MALFAILVLSHNNEGVDISMRKDIEVRLGESVIIKDNALDYQYLEESNQIETK